MKASIRTFLETFFQNLEKFKDCPCVINKTSPEKLEKNN